MVDYIMTTTNNLLNEGDSMFNCYYAPDCEDYKWFGECCRDTSDSLEAGCYTSNTNEDTEDTKCSIVKEARKMYAVSIKTSEHTRFSAYTILDTEEDCNIWIKNMKEARKDASWIYKIRPATAHEIKIKIEDITGFY